MNLRTLKATRPDMLVAAAESFRKAGSVLEQAVDRIDLDVRRPLYGEAWRGSANHAALAHIGKVRDRLVETKDELRRADEAVRQFATALACAKQLVAEAENIAVCNQLYIDENGSVHVSPSILPINDLNTAIRLNSAIKDVAAALQRALELANEADFICARALTSQAASCPAGLIPGSNGTGGGRSTFDAIRSSLSKAHEILGTVGDVSTVVAQLQIPGVSDAAGLFSDLYPPIPGRFLFEGYEVVSLGWDLVDQGLPWNAFEERGSDYAADVFKTGFKASALALSMQPVNPALMAAVVVTGTGWAVSAHWEKIEDGFGWVGEKGHDLLSWGWGKGDDIWDAGWDWGKDNLWEPGKDLVGGLVSGVKGIF